MLRLVFAAPVDPTVLTALDGVSDVIVEGKTADLHLAGPVAPLLRAALDHDLVDLVVRHADLDELFMSYYGGENSSDPS